MYRHFNAMHAYAMCCMIQFSCDHNGDAMTMMMMMMIVKKMKKNVNTYYYYKL